MSLRAIIWCAVSTKAQADDEKASLPAQEAEARNYCERMGWHITDVLQVPGHSRSYIDFYELASDAAKEGIDAFYRLRDHWKAKDFDVLIVRDGDRFSREQASVAFIIGSVVQSGARIFSFQDGWIDDTSYRFHSALIGYKAASEVDQLKKKQKQGKDKKAEQGLYYNAAPAWSHKVIRDDLGHAVKIVPDDSKRYIIEDAARLLIEGVGWFSLEAELYQRFGHINPTPGKSFAKAGGKRIPKQPEPFTEGFFYQLFHNPMFWGHIARGWRNTRTGQKTDMWVFDPHAPTPEGLLIFYNMHEPAIDGELAENVKAELRRRRSVIRGTARPRRTKRFSGLLVCDKCGYYMTCFDNGEGYAYYRCPSKYIKGNRPKCQKVQYIPEREIEAHIDEILRQAISTGNLRDFLAGDDDGEGQLKAVQDRIATVEARSRKLIEKQIEADGELSKLYDEQLKACADELKSLKHRYADLARRVDTTHKDEVLRALETVKQLSLEGFWKQTETVQNQLLHRLMGKTRFVVRDKHIIGVKLFV